MIRNLKALGLAAMAVFAMTAISASAAQAAPLFHAEEAPVTYKGENVGGKEKFKTSAGTVECTTTSVTGESSESTSTEATISPTYTGCKAFGFLTATVTMNGCSYKFHLVEGSSPATATVDIVCPAGKDITISSTGCVVHVPAQTGLKHVVFDNEGSGATRDIKATNTVTGIKYTATGGCPGGEGTKEDGEYSGTTTVKGFKSGGAQQGIFVE
jgi:hypothetical protein